jgi:hypothetical protein
MKFVVEVTSDRLSGGECLSRAIVDGRIGTAKKKASVLLDIWAHYGANSVRILAGNGNQLLDVSDPAATTSERAA